MNTSTHNVEWIYFFEEPKRHKGIIELGRTGRSVEDRNRDKRSVDPWKEIARYPVVSCEQAENEIIRATKNYRYGRRKEILEVDWPTLKNIVEPICQRYTHHEMKTRILKLEAESSYQSSLKQLILDYEKQLTRIRDEYRLKLNYLIDADNEIIRIKEESNIEDPWLTIFVVGMVMFFMFSFLSYKKFFIFFLISFFFLFGFISTIFVKKKYKEKKIQEIINQHKKDVYQKEKAQIDTLKRAFEIKKQEYDTTLRSRLELIEKL